MYQSIIKFSMSGLLALTFSAGTSAQGAFSLSGSLKGIPDSVKVVLVDVEDPNGERTVLAETMATGDSFRLSGDVSSPRMCNLAFQRFSPKRGEYATVFSTRFMADPASITLSAELPFDSLRKVRDIERHIRVSGSKANDEFAEYIAQVSPAELAAQEAAYRSASKYFETNDNKDTMAVYDKVKKQTAANLLKAQRDFIAAHPAYNISAYLTQRELEKVFAYTADEVEAMTALVKACTDTARTSTVEKRKRHALRYALNRPCPEFEVTDPDGKTAQFTSLLTPGKYTFVDLWASWCGPCRAAIPHVRELHKKYADKLNVFSVSLDQSDKPWRKAMDEEKMEWPQYHLEGEKQMTEGMQAFFISSIPRLILLDDQGRVVCSTHLPDEITAYLATHLGE